MQYTEKTEICLVQKAATGDEAAFAELVRACQSTLYAVAMAVTRNHQDALDAVQEGILKGWRKLPSFRAESQFSTWMTRIVIRSALDINRRRKPSSELTDDIPGRMNHNDVKMDVRRAVEGLEEKIRLCTVLFYFEDMPVHEIAKVLGIRQGTVKSRLFRAQAQLKELLEDYRDD